MGKSTICTLLNSDCEITPETAESNFIFDLVLDDIIKHSDSKYDKDRLTNYFHSALGMLWSAVEKRGFLAGIKTGMELFSPPDFNEFDSKAGYVSLTKSV